MAITWTPHDGVRFTPPVAGYTRISADLVRRYPGFRYAPYLPRARHEQIAGGHQWLAESWWLGWSDACRSAYVLHLVTEQGLGIEQAEVMAELGLMR